MSLDESLFQFFWNKQKKFRQKRKMKGLEKAAFLVDYNVFLEFLLNFITGQNFRIQATSGRPTWRGAIFKLPIHINISKSTTINYGFYIFLTIYLGLLYKKINEINGEKKRLYKDKVLASVYNYHSVIDELKVLFPHFNLNELAQASPFIEAMSKVNEVSQEQIREVPIWFPQVGDSTHRLSISGKEEELHVAQYLPEGTEIKNKQTIEEVNLIELEENPNLNPAVHFYEKVKTADIFKGGERMIDGDDELADHQTALEELELKEITRSKSQTRSIFQADLNLSYQYTGENSNEVVDPSASYYDEWDYGINGYKKNWCQLREENLDSLQEEAKAELDKNKMLKIRHIIEAVQVQKRWHNRQRRGDDFDLDALLDARTSILAGHTPNENYYIMKRKNLNDLSTYILLDTSLSTDAWIANKRVLNIEQDSLNLFLHAVWPLEIRIGVGAFYSNTHKDCRYLSLKELNQKQSLANLTKKIYSLKPQGYTRIGPALRHATEKMRNSNTKQKVILLLSDGKPTDYDAYEGKYGIADIRQAVLEAQKSNIRVFGLAIDKQSKYYFPKLFGANNYKILEDASQLPDALTNFYKSWL